MSINTTPPPSPELYNQVRGGLVMKGTTLSAWCREHGYNPTNAKACLVGVWNGLKGTALRERLIEASGMPVSSPVESESHSTADQAEATEAEEFFYWGC